MVDVAGERRVNKRPSMTNLNSEMQPKLRHRYFITKIP